MKEGAHRPAEFLKYAAAAGLMVSALAYLFFGNTAVAQKWRLSRAATEREVIVQRSASDPRFQQVRIGVGTTTGGASLLVQGTLASESDLQSLKELVASTRPRTHVQYRVVVQPK